VDAARRVGVEGGRLREGGERGLEERVGVEVGRGRKGGGGGGGGGSILSRSGLLHSFAL
jgi:hypothetical protein